MICPVCKKKFRGRGITANLTEKIFVQLCYKLSCRIYFGIKKSEFDKLQKITPKTPLALSPSVSGAHVGEPMREEQGR